VTGVDRRVIRAGPADRQRPEDVEVAVRGVEFEIGGLVGQRRDVRARHPQAARGKDHDVGAAAVVGLLHGGA
jgi:hypothetical protein